MLKMRFGCACRQRAKPLYGYAVMASRLTLRRSGQLILVVQCEVQKGFQAGCDMLELWQGQAARQLS